jgi:hypothetical protein
MVWPAIRGDEAEAVSGALGDFVPDSRIVDPCDFGGGGEFRENGGSRSAVVARMSHEARKKEKMGGDSGDGERLCAEEMKSGRHGRKFSVGIWPKLLVLPSMRG